MDLGLRGKIALVAAASRGLGRAIAFELANEGASVVLCARNAEVLAAARDDIAARTGAKVHAIAADVGNSTDLARLITDSVKTFGRIDILVTNSGGPPAGMFAAHAWEAWQSAVDLM